MNDSPNNQLDDALRFIKNQRRQLEQLRNRVSRLEGVLDHCLGSEEGMWLWQNRSQRMDPLVPIFDPLRAAFHLARYEFAIGYSRERKVCDVACGTGYGAHLLTNRGHALSVDGFDCCEQTILYATKKYGGSRVRFTKASAENLPVSNQEYDLITSFETIEHVGEPESVIAEFSRVLKSDGILICSTPNQWPLEIAPYHTHVFDRDSFIRLLEIRFKICGLFNQNSGSDWPYNHQQPAGHTPTTDQNHHTAECFIAVCELR